MKKLEMNTGTLVSKNVVKDITKNKMVKKTTTTHHVECECKSFDCLHDLENQKGFSLNSDDKLTFADREVIQKKRGKLEASITVLFNTIKKENGNNIIEVIKTVTEVTTLHPKETEEREETVKEKFLKGLNERFSNLREQTGKENPTSKDLIRIFATTDMDEIFGKKIIAMPIDMSNFPSFDEFMTIVNKSFKNKS